MTPPVSRRLHRRRRRVGVGRRRGVASVGVGRRRRSASSWASCGVGVSVGVSVADGVGVGVSRGLAVLGDPVGEVVEPLRQVALERLVDRRAAARTPGCARCAARPRRRRSRSSSVRDATSSTRLGELVGAVLRDQLGVRAAAGGRSRAAASASPRRSSRGIKGAIDRTEGVRRESPAGWQPGSPPARPRCRTRPAATSAVHRSRVEHQPGRARVAVARLAGAAGVDQPLAGGDVELVALAPGRAGRRLALVAVEGERDVRVADERHPVVAWRRGTARRSARRARTPRSGRAARRGRARRPRAPPSGDSESRNSRVSGLIVSLVHWAASAAPREKSSSESTSTTARSWLPARQIAQCSHRQRDRGVGVPAVADEVAQAPQLVGLRGLGGARSRPRRRACCRGCPRRWRCACVQSFRCGGRLAFRSRWWPRSWWRRQLCSSSGPAIWARAGAGRGASLFQPRAA